MMSEPLTDEMLNELKSCYFGPMLDRVMGQAYKANRLRTALAAAEAKVERYGAALEEIESGRCGCNAPAIRIAREALKEPKS